MNKTKLAIRIAILCITATTAIPIATAIVPMGACATDSIGAEPLAGIVNPLAPYDSSRLFHDTAALAQRYPAALSLSSIGKSALGKDIPLLKLGHGGRHVLWIGALHSREPITAAYLLLVAEEYANAYCGAAPYAGYSAERVKQLLSEFTVFIVPMANPDGVDIATAGGPANVEVANSGKWKCNANGVNLNRNFPFDWEKNKESVSKYNYEFYKGPSAGSEPETKALMELCATTPFEHMVSCHTQGQVLYWRDNKNGEVPGDIELAGTIAGICGFRLLPSTKFASDGWGGGFENWFRSEYGRPGICLEFCRRNVVDKDGMQSFHAPDMIDWPRSKGLVLGVLDSLPAMPQVYSICEVSVDGAGVAAGAVNIGGAPFASLYDIANFLNGTDKQFNIAFDEFRGAVLLRAGRPYKPVGGEVAGSELAGGDAANGELAGGEPFYCAACRPTLAIALSKDAYT
jgi:predicted deacylase